MADPKGQVTRPDDIVARLRRVGLPRTLEWNGRVEAIPILTEAADEIVNLRAALKTLLVGCEMLCPDEAILPRQMMLARRALGE